MINLDNIKIVLFDFDDTLCIHTNHTNFDGDDLVYNTKVLKEGIKAWDSCKTNIHMKKFLDECVYRKIRVGLISTTHSYVHMKEKHNWVLKNYDVNLENFCVGTYEGKLEIMIAISEAFNVNNPHLKLVKQVFEVGACGHQFTS